MSTPLPSIGSHGIWTLMDPFQNALVTGVGYTCLAVRNLSDITVAGGDAYNDYYFENYSIPQIKFDEDVRNEVCIISLQSSAGTVVYVPSSYILKFPATGGVPYTAIALAVSLGAIPDSLDLSFVKAKITQVVHDALGVNPTIQLAAQSESTLVPQVAHASYEAARQLNITERQTDYSKYLEAAAARDKALQQITALTQYIKDHIAP